jgi:membrane fusion protein (multidrug efflux system)
MSGRPVAGAAGPADYLVQLAQAESQLAQTARQTRTLYANNAPLAAQVAQREADLLRLRPMPPAKDDVARRRPHGHRRRGQGRV